MSVHCRTGNGTLEVVDGPGLGGKLIGGLLFLFPCSFLYYLWTIVASVIRFGFRFDSWKDAISSLGGLLLLIILIALSGIAALVAMPLKKRTLFNKAEGLVTYTIPALRLTKTFLISDIKRIVVIRYTESNPNARPPYAVNIMPNWIKVEIAAFGFSEKNSALELGRQLAVFLGVEFLEEHTHISNRRNTIGKWALLKESWHKDK